MQDNVLNDLIVVKRTGQRVSFNGTKIAVAIKSAFDNVESKYTEKDINKVYSSVLKYISNIYMGRKTISVEDIQDIIEEELKSNNYYEIYEAFNFYRLRRAASRGVFSEKQQHKFVKTIEKLGLQTNSNLYTKPLDVMYGFGKTVSCEFAKAYLLENKYVRAHDEGIIYIHDIESYPLYTMSMAHLNFDYLPFAGVNEYITNLVDIIRNCKKEQTGEHSINSIDNLLMKVLNSNFKIIFTRNLTNYLKINGLIEFINLKQIRSLIEKIDFIDFDISLFEQFLKNNRIKNIFESAYYDSFDEIKEILYDSIKNMLKNLNELECDINNGKVIISLSNNNIFILDIYLKALLNLERLENVTTVLKINFSNSINSNIIESILLNKNVIISYDNNSEYFSNGERLYENINSNINSSSGRCILSTTSINLSRIGIINKDKSIDEFYKNLSSTLDFTKNQLVQRFELQVNKYKKNFPSLFKYNLLMDSEKLDESQKIRKVLKNGVLNIGLIGLDECVQFLINSDKKISKLDILNFIDKKIKQYIDDTKLNFILSQTQDKSILNQMLAVDKSIYGTNLFGNKNHYSLVGDIDFKDLDSSITHIQNILSMRVNIYLGKNSSDKKVLQVLEKANELGIKFFSIYLE